MKLTIEKCNAKTDNLCDYISRLPERIAFEKVKDPTSELFSDLNADGAIDISSEIPMYTKRKAIDLHSFLQRCKEEELLLSVETERLLLYYKNMCTKIDRELAVIGDVTESGSTFSNGARHELMRLRTRLQNELFEMKKSLGLPPGETIFVQAELQNLALDGVELYTDADHETAYSCEESDNEEDIEELSDIESDNE